MNICANSLIQVNTAEENGIITIKTTGNAEYTLSAPVFEINGAAAGGGDIVFSGVRSERTLRNSGTELKLEFRFRHFPGLRLAVDLRYFPDSPFVRYRYVLQSDTPVALTKKEGRDDLLYTGFHLRQEGIRCTEIQMSQFDPMNHCYRPAAAVKDQNELGEGCAYPGPITVMEHDRGCILIAYEHGAEHPDTYIEHQVKACDDGLSLKIAAVKGNYFHGEEIGAEHSLITPWFHAAAIDGGQAEMLKHYRRFFLKHISENNESRKPYVYYNTWNAQERDKYYGGIPYLANINLDHMLNEIEIAHRMGIDVFVIDNGWFESAGEWRVDTDKFPDGMKVLKQKIDEYGMKLGLWFNPTLAVKASHIFQSHPEYMMKNEKGEDWYLGTVWEKPDNYGMCLVSDFADYHIGIIKKLHKELGVTYFKWDGLYQFGCTSSLHHHGTADNSLEERHNCYGFRMGLEMIRMVEEVSAACPDVIVDFDVTEDKRFVGLGFLSVGKYFLINNGPYASDFDLPYLPDIASDMVATKIEGQANMFFFPGPARSRICRHGALFDSFVPSVLFLSHFLPDPPVLSQMNSLCSLMLGSNGIWGELADLSEEDIGLFADTISKYKRVRDSVNESYPKAKGCIGSSPEIYDKIQYAKAEGLICFFTKAGGEFTYVTDPMDTGRISGVDGADAWESTAAGRLKVTVVLKDNEARPVFIFGK